MTQSELWLAKWQEAIDFLETNHRKPSTFLLTLKWVFWILVAGIVLVVVLRFGRLLK